MLSALRIVDDWTSVDREVEEALRMPDRSCYRTVGGQRYMFVGVSGVYPELPARQEGEILLFSDASFGTTQTEVIASLFVNASISVGWWVMVPSKLLGPLIRTIVPDNVDLLNIVKTFGNLLNEGKIRKEIHEEVVDYYYLDAEFAQQLLALTTRWEKPVWNLPIV